MTLLHTPVPCHLSVAQQPEFHSNSLDDPGIVNGDRETSSRHGAELIDMIIDQSQILGMTYVKSDHRPLEFCIN